MEVQASGHRWLANLVLVIVVVAGAGTAYFVLRDDAGPAARIQASAPAPPPSNAPAPTVESERASEPTDLERFAACLASHNRRLVWQTLRTVIELGPRAAPLRERILGLADSKDPSVACHAMIALMKIDENRDWLHRLALRVGTHKNAAFYLERFDPVLGRALFAGYSARARLDDASNAAQALDELLALACAADARLGERIRERLHTADDSELGTYLDFATRIEPIPSEVRAELLAMLTTGSAQRVRAVILRLGDKPGHVNDPRPFAAVLGRHYDAGSAELRNMAVAAIGNLRFCDDAWAQRLALAAAGANGKTYAARYAIGKLETEAAGVGVLLMQIAQRAEQPRVDLVPTLLRSAPDAAPALVLHWIEIGNSDQKKKMLWFLRGTKADRETTDRLVHACESGQAGPRGHALGTIICLDPGLESPRVRALVTSSLREPLLEPRLAAVAALRYAKELDAELAALVLEHAMAQELALRRATLIAVAQVKGIDVSAPATRRQLLDLAQNGSRAPGQAADSGSQAIFVELMLRAYKIDAEVREILVAALSSKAKSVRIAAIRGFSDVESLTPYELHVIQGMWRDHDNRIWSVRNKILARHAAASSGR